MESKEIICVSFCLALMLSCIEGGQENLFQSRNYLDSFIHDSSLNTTGRRVHSGILYDISLPSNFSGISASFIRIRSSRLWSSGTNFSLFYIPPKTLSWPYSKRIRIVYKNLGNWSSTYYNVPNYTFVTPVVGFLAYDATNVTTSNNNSGVVVEIRPTSDPIMIVFQNLSLQRQANTDSIQCVQFNSNGEFEFSNVNDVIAGYSCIARRNGHFGIVVPSVIPIPIPIKKKSKQKLWKWWVVGFVVGFCGLILLIGFGILLYKCCKTKRIGRMEKESERSEALESVWVGGTSRMPRANGTRTQPIIEDSYVPS